MQGGDEQQSRDALLSVDEHQVRIVVGGLDAVDRIEPMKCVCPAPASATARTSASSCSQPPMSHRYWR
jgi:hypothetical protein